MPSCRFLAQMIKNKLGRQGFTYLATLTIVMVMGIMLGVIGQSWKTVMQREREEELIFRGQQIKDAIGRWYKPRAGQHAATPLRDLKDLLEDPRSVSTTRYLRRMYLDPMTGKEWKVIGDPAKGIIGVASTSDAKPFKTGGFPDDLADLANKQKYSDWLFVYGTTAANPNQNTLPTGHPMLSNGTP